MKADRRQHLWFVLTILICVPLISTGIVSAQASPIPILIGENQTGTLTDAVVSIPYSLVVTTPLSIRVQVLAISPGFAPTFRILDPSGVILIDAANPGTQTIAEGAPTLSSPGTYVIEIRSANQSSGQFLLSVQPGMPLAPPTPVLPGQPLNGSVDGQHTRQAYAFSGTTDDLLLTVRTDDPAAGVTLALRDADTNQMLSLNSADLIGMRYRFPAAPRNYLLEVMKADSDSRAKTFVVCLETESGSATCVTSASRPRLRRRQPSSLFQRRHWFFWQPLRLTRTAAARSHRRAERQSTCAVAPARRLARLDRCQRA